MVSAELNILWYFEDARADAYARLLFLAFGPDNNHVTALRQNRGY
jgi:hypothetical protein